MKKISTPVRGSPEYIQMQMLPATKEILTTKEAAVYLGLSIHTIYKLIAEKAFPFSKPNFKTIFIRRESLDEWRMQNQSDKQKLKNTITKHFLKI